MQEDGSIASEESEAGDQAGRFISARILADTLSVIAAVPKAEQSDADRIAFETLIDAHHPCIGM
jgi:hypothetical protein